ncbi:MAG: DUF805 domain-containing protein [Alphaproteobacteria bacterium]|jgi:uncharacterized membrane protein YhaH (DUF805 family)|nr:DUF805 domain-containing protein [Alphaproteobacteria bacterium]
MGFKEAVRTCLREKYFTLSGRASRSEYWWFILFHWSVLIGLFLLFLVFVGLEASVVAGYSADNLATATIISMVVLGLVFLFLFIPSITAQVRRFHDRNLSGWWVLAVIILSNVPGIGLLATIAGLVVALLKGTEGDNKYGPDPLRAEHSAEVFA